MSNSVHTRGFKLFQHATFLAQSAEGSHVGLGAAVPHAVAGESLVYEATATTNVTVEGVAAHESTMVTSVLGGETTITVRR